MLLEHYGLREQPFGVTPNPRYLYLSPSHREALASLVYGIDSGRGFLALIAPPGMGKTTLLFQFLERLGATARTVFLFQAQCGSRDLLRSMMSDLGVAAQEEDMIVLQSRLNQILIEELKARRKFVLVIDEAQNLDDSALEFVRMLSNFETPRDKLMNIVLAGQMQLAERLARSSMVQLRQRISMLLRLRPLGPGETGEYIEHRLRVSGYKGAALFSAGALREVAALSGGVPRNINNICFNALSLAYAGGRNRIESAVIREVAADLDLNSFTAEACAAPGGFKASEASGEDLNKRQNRSTRASGWAVLLDRILLPGKESEQMANLQPVLSSSWKQKPGLREAAGSMACGLRDRMMH